MKENSKKSHDAPLRLFVKPEHAGFTSEWIDKEGNQHEGYNVWLGVADERAWGYDEYINLAKVWHQGKELPKSSQDDCLLDYADGMTTEVGHTYTDPDGSRGWLTDSGAHLFEEISQWAYLKDIVPTKLKKGGK